MAGEARSGLEPAAPAEPTGRAWLGSAVVAVGLAAGLMLAGPALVLVLRAPDSELLGQLWRVPAFDPSWRLLCGALALLLLWALRPVSGSAAEGWLARRDLPPRLAAAAAVELRRTRAWRTVPAVAGYSVGIGTVWAVNLALAVHGEAPEALWAAAGAGGWPDGLALALGGYLLGSLAGELRRRRPPAAPGAGARLVTRRPGSYLTRPARLLPDLLATAIGLVCAVALVTGATGPQLVAGLAVAAGLTLGVRAVQWWVVRRPQRLSDQGLIEFDDTLRSSTAHAMVGGSCALGLGVIERLTSQWDWWNAYVAGDLSGWLVWPLLLVSVAASVATLLVWVGYGSRHRGARPRPSHSRVPEPA